LDALKAPAVPPTKGVRDVVGHADTTYSLGFNKPTSQFVFGSWATRSERVVPAVLSDSQIRTPASASLT
jgi:hypothetical protein